MNEIRKNLEGATNYPHMTEFPPLALAIFSKVGKCPLRADEEDEFVINSESRDFNVEDMQKQFEKHYQIGCAGRVCGQKFSLICKFGRKQEKDTCKWFFHTSTSLCLDYCVAERSCSVDFTERLEPGIFVGLATVYLNPFRLINL